MFYMMMASAIFATIVCIAVVFSFRERPGAAIFRPGAANAESIPGEDGVREQLPLMT